jgi:hypothetical protein
LTIDVTNYTLDLDKLTLEMDSAGGVPSKSVMRSNWCTTFFPGNNGLPLSISANMHPMLQISIAGVYCKRQEFEIEITNYFNTFNIFNFLFYIEAVNLKFRTHFHVESVVLYT